MIASKLHQLVLHASKLHQLVLLASKLHQLVLLAIHDICFRLGVVLKCQCLRFVLYTCNLYIDFRERAAREQAAPPVQPVVQQPAPTQGLYCSFI
jgi:hypothetical protein